MEPIYNTLKPIACVSDLTGEKLLNKLATIITLHQELRDKIVPRYIELWDKRQKLSETSETYLKLEHWNITPAENRRYLLQGVESDMIRLLTESEEIISTLNGLIK
jgi:hypothetical protein